MATKPSASRPAPDSLIDHAAGVAYWSSTPATVSGVLGGLPQLSRIDLQGSANFFAKVQRNYGGSQTTANNAKKLARAVDCGAGIGRITRGFLCHVAEKIDLVEPVVAFTDEIKSEPYVGKIVNAGLEDWHPTVEAGFGPYDLIWIQWCIGQLTDAQVVAFLQRAQGVLATYGDGGRGWIVVKENLTDEGREDLFDALDHSVTRSDGKFRKLFLQAGLRVVATEIQRGLQTGIKDKLFAVRAYALQPL